jgi:hypothetical protein
VLLRDYPPTVIRNCVDTTVFSPAARAAGRKRLGLRDNAFMALVGSGSLENPRKNAGALLEALRLLAGRDGHGPLEVCAFGGGELPDTPFPARALGVIRDESALARVYAAADLYINPSLLDNLPNTACEAQCCGTPVVSFDAGGNAETILPGETGFLVQENTATALADTLEEIIRNREALLPMRKAARAFAEKAFAPRGAAAAYTAMFAQAPPAPGLEPRAPLFTALLENQIASVAALSRETLAGSSLDATLTGITAHVDASLAGATRYTTDSLAGLSVWLQERFSGLDARLAEQAAQLEDLRHPPRRSLRALWARWKGPA